MTREQIIDTVKAFRDRRDRLYDSDLQALLSDVVAYLEDGEPPGKASLEWMASVLRCFERDDVPERRIARPSGPGVLVHLTDKQHERGWHLLKSAAGRST